jgi:hypothetical protein
MTIGEKTFEKYLASQSITNFEFEKLPPGKHRPSDYTITREREYLFEVKDFEPTDIPDGGAYDNYARIRSKIDSARRKFREYEGWPCSLVLYNNDAPLVDITTPDTVLGAMYGDAGVVIPFNTETGEAAGEAQSAFLGRGKMIRPGWREPANTRISALITLRYVHVGQMRLRRYVAELKTSAVKRVDRAVDIYNQLSNADLNFDTEEKHLGVIVWANAFAAIPFPRDLFCGEYDEIYDVEDGRQPRVFAGCGILAYEELKEASKPQSLFDVIKNKRISD